jgi:predicted transposase/invertase (TIGR01784 family)
LYSQQLVPGNSYGELRATISICIVNGVLFPRTSENHHEFGLLTKDTALRLSNDLAIHVIELPKFHKGLVELKTPLDLWLYYLQNGKGLDADNLPSRLDTPQIRQAMEMLKMLTQNDIERELYEGRLKAQHDAATIEAERKRVEAERNQAEAERNQAKAELADWEQRYAEAARERDAANRKLDDARKLVLIERIQLCERLLKQSPSGTDQLAARGQQELDELATRLERQIAGSLN